MPIFKRKDSPNWWLKICVSGHRVQKSTGTTDKQKAQEYHDKLKAQLWDEIRLGIKPEHTWNEAVVRWLKETSHKASQQDDVLHLRWIDKYFSNFKLNQITRDELEKILEARKAEGVSNSTVNRMLEVVRAILRRAANDWEWIDRAPKVRMLPKAQRRVRWLKPKEARALLAELPSHLHAMALFTLETGLRQRNVTQLEWSQVDLKRSTAWIHPDQAKARKAIPVPLSKRVLTLLHNLKGMHDRYVFTYNGKPVNQPNNSAWRKALHRAGITDFRWHDLRHTWASWHAQRGTPLNVLQELGGWSTAEMVRRYAHLSSEHLSPYAENMSQNIEYTTKEETKSYVIATS